jgi:hypothetical protein
MKKVTLAIFALATAVAISPVALIGQSTNFTNFTININVPGISNVPDGFQLSGTGTYSTAPTYNPSGSGATTDGYLITSFNGTISGSAPATGTASLLDTSSMKPVPAPGSSFLSPDGQFQVDDLLFPGNNVVGANSGYFDNLGLLLNVVGVNSVGQSVDYEVNIFTGSQNGIYPGPAGVPYQVVYSDGYYTVTFTPAPSGPSVTVPEYGGLAMLILSALTLAGGFSVKARQSGMFLAA